MEYKWFNDVMDRKTTLRIIGFIASLVLTFVIYSLVVHPALFHLGPDGAVRAMLILAVLMAVIQCLFFLDIVSERDALWNIGFFVATLSVVAIIVFFSMWIMASLDYNMMPGM
jgi:heme/copper-type cytochrome/quinol oxidase subunit 4